MSTLFEVLLYEAINVKADVPVLVSIGANATICGSIDSSQECSPFGPPRYTRLLNAALVDSHDIDGETSLLVPRPPDSSAISLSGGPNRRWLITIGALTLSGEEVSWDQWLDYNSCTNGGGWDSELVAGLKRRYPLSADERAYFHLINVQFHGNQSASPLGGPIYIPTDDITCFGSQR